MDTDFTRGEVPDEVGVEGGSWIKSRQKKKKSTLETVVSRVIRESLEVWPSPGGVANIP